MKLEKQYQWQLAVLKHATAKTILGMFVICRQVGYRDFNIYTQFKFSLLTVILSLTYRTHENGFIKGN